MKSTDLMIGDWVIEIPNHKNVTGKIYYDNLPELVGNVEGAKSLKLTPEQIKEFEDRMYKNGWKDLGRGLKMDRDGHIAGGLKLK